MRHYYVCLNGDDSEETVLMYRPIIAFAVHIR